MKLEAIVEYNKQQAEKYEWSPEWFGATSFNEHLVSKIKKFQKENGLTADGMCGPSTYRRIWTERDSQIDVSYKDRYREGQKYIVHNSLATEIKWDKVVLWSEDNGLKCKKGSYTDKSGQVDREPKLFVNHWDVCLSSRSCARVLNKRKLSVHFLIDNDGTIFQCLDTQHVAWHAGNFNQNSIGVEISTAYSLKYQDWYVRNGFGKRPIWDNSFVHGRRLSPFLGFYEVQLDALSALWAAVSTATQIPLISPTEPHAIPEKIHRENFSGFLCHYHLTRKKIDCAGLSLSVTGGKARLLQE